MKSSRDIYAKKKKTTKNRRLIIHFFSNVRRKHKKFKETDSQYL